MQEFEEHKKKQILAQRKWLKSYPKKKTTLKTKNQLFLFKK